MKKLVVALALVVVAIALVAVWPATQKVPAKAVNQPVNTKVVATPKSKEQAATQANPVNWANYFEKPLTPVTASASKSAKNTDSATGC